MERVIVLNERYSTEKCNAKTFREKWGQYAKEVRITESPWCIERKDPWTNVEQLQCRTGERSKDKAQTGNPTPTSGDPAEGYEGAQNWFWERGVLGSIPGSPVASWAPRLSSIRQDYFIAQT
jgi:hypothetical protein